MKEGAHPEGSRCDLCAVEEGDVKKPRGLTEQSNVTEEATDTQHTHTHTHTLTHTLQ